MLWFLGFEDHTFGMYLFRAELLRYLVLSFQLLVL